MTALRQKFVSLPSYNQIPLVSKPVPGGGQLVRSLFEAETKLLVKKQTIVECSIDSGGCSLSQ